MASVRKRKWTHKGEEKEVWIVDYVDNGGARRCKTFRLKKEADRYRVKVEGEIVAGVHVAINQTKTLGQLAEDFLRYQEDRYRDGRISFGRLKGIKTAVTVSLIPLAGHHVMTSLNHDSVDRLYRDMMRSGKLAPDTAKERIKLLCNMEDFANKREIMKTRPVFSYLKELRGVKRNKIDTFTAEEVDRLLAESLIRPKFVAERSARLIAIYVHLASRLGLRQGEITGLSLDSVDFEHSIMRIRQSYTRHTEASVGMIKGPKTRAGIRDVPIPESVLALLREWVASFYIPNEMGLLLTLGRGQPVRYRNWYRGMWLPLLTRAGLASTDDKTHRHFHALRHFAASNMLLHKIPLADVSAMIGHENISTTVNVYVHQLGEIERHRGIFEQMALPGSTSDAARAQHEHLSA